MKIYFLLTACLLIDDDPEVPAFERTFVKMKTSSCSGITVKAIVDYQGQMRKKESGYTLINTIGSSDNDRFIPV